MKDEERDILAVGLPASFFEEDLKSGGVAAGRLERRFKEMGYRDVFVLPQGLGGIKWFLKSNPDVKENILGIDIGFNTVIVVLYSAGEKEILISRTYYKKGIYDLTVSLLLPRIKKFVGDRTLTPIELNYLMEHKKLQIGFDVVDLVPEVEESVEDYVQDLISFIMNDIKSSFGVVPFSYAVFMGGGANWLRGKVEGNKVKIVIPEEPEFANAYGFREKALEAAGSETEEELTEEEMFDRMLSGEYAKEILGKNKEE